MRQILGRVLKGVFKQEAIKVVIQQEPEEAGDGAAAGHSCRVAQRRERTRRILVSRAQLSALNFLSLG